ncbi:T9SS type A sorting domain-containing protein [Aquimarina spinulae]|uniref:T9SS type A sorting domain-containing protein n=1 Tax=Aquimarina spinulae TaxID=1192023 RepID=UPI000D5578D5|nr:T9SS type A sorting domain-containing protein [Aquimarina spinulae]
MIILTQKKWICSCIALVTLTLSLKAQEVIIPDTKFKQALLRNHNIDTNNNGKIEVSEAQAYTGTITVSGGPISNLIGIDAFKNITGLSISKTSIRELDLSKNTKLKTLAFNRNYKVTDLDLSKNTKLIDIRCNQNNLKSLTILSRDLIFLNCNFNKLSSLFLPNSRKLQKLYCRDNEITELKLSRQKELKEFSCSRNKITQLDISNSTKLEGLYCYNNKLKSLNISKNTKLEQLYCFNNKLKSLNISKNTKLKKLLCDNNKLTSLIASNNSKLDYMDARQNSIDCIVGHPANGATWLKDPETEFCPEKSRTAKKEELHQKEITTYPNPVQNILYIQTGQVEKSPVTIALTTLKNGRSRAIKRIPNNKGVVSINMSAYKTGLYTLKIITKDRVITRKIVKQ